MKSTTFFAVASIALAMVTTGCRYDKAAGDGSGDGSGDGAANGSDIREINSDIDENAEGGDLADLEGKSFKDRGYKVCTDVSFDPVYFAYDATTLKSSEMAKVESVARHLADNPARVVSIEGNCDERGSNEYNLSLGEDRAIVISNFLQKNGIAADRVETVSRGETNPAVEGTGESAWSLNRRGEFVIMQK